MIVLGRMILNESRPPVLGQGSVRQEIKSDHRLIRFPGLLTAADQLGVHRNHLYLVLSGQRTSHKLMRRYQALKKEAA